MESLNEIKQNECSVKLCFLTANDYDDVCRLDDLSGNYVSQWINEEELPDHSVSDYAFGIIVDNKLIGYCTIGYADDVGSSIENDIRHTYSSLLLSDVFVMPEYRNSNVGSFLVSEALKYKLSELEPSAPNVFIQLLHDGLYSFYSNLGFEWLDEAHEYIMIGDRENILSVDIECPFINEEVER